MRRLSITQKLAIIYLAVAVPLVATLAISYYVWFEGRIALALANRNEIANLAASSFNYQIQEIDRTMMIAGESIVDNNYSQARTVSVLSKVRDLYPAGIVLMTDRFGVVKTSTDSRLVGTNLSGNAAFEGIVKGRATTGMAPTEHVYGIAGFYTAQAITSGGELQGIVASFIDISKLYVTVPGDIKRGDVNIVDSGGRLVYLSGHREIALENPYWGKYGFVKYALAGKESSSTDWLFPGTGETNFVFEVPIHQLKWAAGSSIPRKEALAPTLKAALGSSIITVIVLSIAFLVGLKIARGITRPLALLVAKAKRIGNGHLEEPVQLKTGDEIEHVADSLDNARQNLKETVEELRKSRDELELRVEERTAELSDSISRIQSLLESTGEGIYGADVDGVCILFNKSAAAMTGFSSVEVIGKKIHDIIHYKHADGSPYPFEDCPITKTLKTKSSIRISSEVFWRKDGTSFPVEYSACPIIEDSSVKGYVVAFTDIAERKITESLNRAMDEVNTAIGSTLDIDQIMERVVAKAAEAIDAESGIIIMSANDRWVVKYGYGIMEETVGLEFSGDEIGSVLNKIRNKQSFVENKAVIEEGSGSLSPVKRVIKKYNISSCMCAPLTVKDDIVGILAIARHATPTFFPQNQIDFINKLILSISLALENARLYKTERDIADTLQEALLVLPEKIHGVKFGYLYSSATESAKVGGDFYDLFELEHDRVGIIIGDVSGKGIEASALTSITKNTLKAYAYEGDSPATVLKKTNGIIAKTSMPGMFVTLFFGILEVNSGRLVYCNAGHPAAIVKREAKKETKQETVEIELLIANSPIVGAFENLEFLDNSILIDKDDSIVFYTDGVIEARRDNEFLGEDGLVAIVKQVKGESVDSLPGIIFSEVIEFTGNNLLDDVAVVAVSLEKQ